MKFFSLSEKFKETQKGWKKYFGEKYGFRFYNPTYSKVPSTKELFSDPGIISDISQIEYHLLATYPIYMGTNNRKKIKKISSSLSTENGEWSWFTKHNKLGLNRIFSIYGNLYFLKSKLTKVKIDESPFLLEDVNYSSLSFKKKCTLFEKLDKGLYSLLEEISDKYESNSLENICDEYQPCGGIEKQLILKL